MASNISDGNSKYLDKFSCHCEDSSLTENRDIRHVNENNRLDSCNGGADQQDDIKCLKEQSFPLPIYL
jgi:hypothetical protein